MKLKDDPNMMKVNSTDYGVCADPIPVEDILIITQDASDADKWLKCEYAKLKTTVNSRLDARDLLTNRILKKLTDVGFTDSRGYGLDECKQPNDVKYHKDRVTFVWNVSSCQAGWISGVRVEANYTVLSMPTKKLQDMKRLKVLDHLVSYREIEP